MVIRQKWEKIKFFWNFTIIFFYLALFNHTQPLSALIACCQEPSQEVWSHCTEKWAFHTCQNSKVYKFFLDFWLFWVSRRPEPKIFFHKLVYPPQTNSGATSQDCNQSHLGEKAPNDPQKRPKTAFLAVFLCTNFFLKKILNFLS